MRAADLLYATAMLQIDTRELGSGITVVTLAGKITLGPESHQIESVVKDLLKQNRRKLIFDLSGITYIDSTGLGILTFCSSRATEAGGKLCIAGAASLPARLFHITRLDTIIALYPSVEAARESLAAGTSG